MAKVTEKDLDMVALLSRLEIPETDKARSLEQLDAFLQYVDNLSAIPTDDVEPLAHVLPIHNVFREDVVRPSLDRDLALSNAPLQEDGYFKVPKILED
ncbi:MAG: Asp-tRNA(Asn)/Glu-tRNA(Gln) amidotransferase subunit GatC [Selenomonadaceae bacterium]|nr:Asp-tRNA(Asn)/Glu-tRNA(Gln) amidotransferase subunit GatC [Selenomonadaceae bacterium]